ncbi:MAG: PilZ domain-containing protein [Gammaproteobacteria bacterium]|nr:PilZ domain-containing protein [Gammaproteobacteria bacterium]
MTASDIHATALIGAPSYEAALPLHWTPLAEAIGGLRREQYNDDNLRVLAAVAVLDESRSSPVPDEAAALDAEIGRLNQKLNLVIDLLGFLIAQQAAAPPAGRVRLSWQGAVFVGPQTAGEAGLLSLQLHRSVPQPFIWPARISHVDGEERHARFAPFGDALQTALERHVFLRHRRAIAGHRRGAS